MPFTEETGTGPKGRYFSLPSLTFGQNSPSQRPDLPHSLVGGGPWGLTETHRVRGLAGDARRPEGPPPGVVTVEHLARAIFVTYGPTYFRGNDWGGTVGA